MEEARAEGNEIISAYKTALEKVFEDHKKEAVRQSQTRVRAESTNARQQKNQAMAKAQLDLKRQQGKVQQELKNKLFAEVADLVRDFMKTPDYDAFLVKCIESALEFASGEEMTIYINPSDRDKKEKLEEKTGAVLTVSAEDFMGGVRAVLRGRNILIDHSFKASLENEYDQFIFSGGDDIG
ncbi:V-type ATP synthase subunit E [Lachnospiraceae bacterium DSM 108991]|uniref:V-type ATP synthase subunit E n=2 Tax=Claveliimonas monacensis TaxID=2779351 RepID=A0ABR9RI42_9FIRM|nr:V-type ATP synthase subunit E [Claveliimonas monacensis]